MTSLIRSRGMLRELVGRGLGAYLPVGLLRFGLAQRGRGERVAERGTELLGPPDQVTRGAGTGIGGLNAGIWPSGSDHLGMPFPVATALRLRRLDCVVLL